MYYFAYCTWLSDAELRKYVPEAKFVTKAKAHNWQIQFRAASGREDRGWCHLHNMNSWGFVTQGMVFEVNDDRVNDDFDDFGIIAITVHGDDGKAYDCFTYDLLQPGIPMRPPNFYWRHVPEGLAEQNFPADYVATVNDIFNKASPCPDADRPAPTAPPGRDASTR